MVRLVNCLPLFTLRQNWRHTLSDRQNWILDEGRHDLDEGQSAAGVYHFLATHGSLNYRFLKRRFNLTAGITAVPLHTRLSFDRKEVFRDTATTSFHFAPNLTLHFFREEGEKLQLTYKSYETAPRVGHLLPLASNTNPVYIQMPNTGLRPSFTHDISLNWIKNDARNRHSVSFSGSYRMVQDAFSTSTTYNAASGTGGRIVTPINIDGNRQAGAGSPLRN